MILPVSKFRSFAAATHNRILSSSLQIIKSTWHLSNTWHGGIACEGETSLLCLKFSRPIQPPPIALISLDILVSFQSMDFSYCRVVSLPAILNTTVTTHLPALPSNFFSHLSLLVQFASFNTKPMLPPAPISNFLHEGSNSLSSKSFSAITSCYCFLFQHACQVPSHHIFLHWHLSPQSRTNFNHLAPIICG